MSLYRILIASNYDSETFNESFLNVPFMPKIKAERICETLNEIDPQGINYYKVVKPSHALHAFES